MQDDALLAYQIGFDLFDNEMQSFSQQVRLTAYCWSRWPGDICLPCSRPVLVAGVDLHVQVVT